MKELFINYDNKLNKTIALTENAKIVEVYNEGNKVKRIEGDVYLGRVADVILGMQAAFIDIGEEQNAYLHIKDILPKKSNETGNKEEQFTKYNIKDYIKQGNYILVQVKKDKNERKGARVSTHLNLAGRFVALMPNLDFVTISNKIENENEILRLKQIVKNINTENHGIILRTSSVGKELQEIEKDINNLKNIYNEILTTSENVIKENKKIPQKIYETGSIINKILIDLIDSDLKRIVVNNKEIFDKINLLLSTTKNHMKIKLEYIEKEFILDIYDIDKQISKMENIKIWLKCGGFITIEKTEALTAIDVNTGKFTGKSNLEETVFNVNTEATEEIARQIRLRDIGGIIIIDYIDMENKLNEEKIEKLLLKHLKQDRAKTQIIGFTPLKLLEMTRKHMFSK